jgi:hypothetical protein
LLSLPDGETVTFKLAQNPKLDTALAAPLTGFFVLEAPDKLGA